MRPTPSTRSRNEIFHNTLKEIEPDIAILTETHDCINAGKEYFKAFSSCYIHVSPPNRILYKPGENAVSIYSKYPFIKKYTTSDHYRSVCAETTTPIGNLIIYGTIIGLQGGMLPSFKKDYEAQVKDLEAISKHGNVCFGGDLNISFSGYTYPSKPARSNAQKKFEELGLNIVTGGIPDCVIHSVIDHDFLKDREVSVMACQFEKKVTDHKLVLVTIK